MTMALTIEAARTQWCAARKVEIHGLTEQDALHLAEAFIVPFLRTTAGDVTIRLGSEPTA